jgi:quercetin dioxygenase-like cupin family protein
MPDVQPMVAAFGVVYELRNHWLLRVGFLGANYPRSGARIAHRSTPVPFIDTSALEVIERLPGWYGRYFHSPSMTFAHYDFKSGSSIHEHFHPQEEVYEVIEGELELTIDGVKQVARPGMVGIVPSNVRHSVKAVTDGRAIIVDYPVRREMGETRS